MLQYRAYAYFSRRCIHYCGSTQLLFLLNIKRTKPSNWAYCSTAVKILNIGLFSVEPVMSHVFHIFIFLFLFFFSITGICNLLNSPVRLQISRWFICTQQTVNRISCLNVSNLFYGSSCLKGIVSYIN